jgi:hypothetical protein
MGYILYLITTTNDFTGYAVRVSDLEGVRRAALLAVGHAIRRSDASMPLRRIEASAWRNPYTDRAFQWEPPNARHRVRGPGGWGAWASNGAVLMFAYELDIKSWREFWFLLFKAKRCPRCNGKLETRGGPA